MVTGAERNRAESSVRRASSPLPPPTESSPTGLQHINSALRSLGEPIKHRLSLGSPRPTGLNKPLQDSERDVSLSPPPSPAPNRALPPRLSVEEGALVSHSDEKHGPGHVLVRTVPSWVHTYNGDESEIIPGATSSLPTLDEARATPHGPDLMVSQHTPTAPRARLHDAMRTRETVTIRDADRGRSQRWQTFVKVSAQPINTTEQRQVVSEEWLVQHMPNLDRPWLAELEKGQQEHLEVVKRKEESGMEKFERILLRHPWVPFTFRIIIFTFSVIALALGGSIATLSRTYGFYQRSSTLIAIIFDSIALLYIFYITHDEYFGKPLGLRSAAAKIRLILLDLLFIVFNSANLSLAFDALTDVRWSCKESGLQESVSGNRGHRIAPLCDRQRALSGVLLIVLLAWLLTFAVSVLRVVARVAGEE